MNKIKFSHVYEKMPLDAEIHKHRLLQTITIDINELSKWFIAYDTEYIVKENTISKGVFTSTHTTTDKYPLPMSRLILLMLYDLRSWELWTTVRRYTPDKYKWYHSQIGEEFEIEITEE